MDEEKTDTENTGAEESKPEETSDGESKTEDTPTEETKTEDAPAAEESKTEDAPAAEETKTEESPAETATAEAPAEQESTPADDAGGDGKRPVFLTVLCILTFIGSGLGLLGSLLMVVGVGAIMDMLGGLGGAVSGGVAYFGVATVLAAASLFGALQMWKLKKMGFYLYVGAQLIGAILPLVWLGSAFAIMGFLWPVVFIVLYGLNLKHMK